ncbi:C6 zinc finger domain-containing protein [Penicillium angulare]|uniref:C6 zinc finger domain-containing protein n=1 Tax=Penicillium angulare TaxID=116970 RepID=A0A9W9FYE6_9EURO|nr:C6 zinc finger domain-containing protein [Penicillium angulare]
MSKGTSAIFHYNTAIQQVIVSRHKNLDTVVITCILFISIELLRGNLKGAWMHYRHGREVLASYDAPQQLLCIFRQLNTFALFFFDVSGLSPLNKAGFPPPGGPFTNITQAQESLDFLLYRSMKIAFDLGKGISTGYVRRGVSRRRKLRDDLKTWSHAVSSLKQDSTHNEALYQALEARSLVCEIWTDPALYEYQEHYSKPEESNVGSIGEFLSSTRIPTVLNFMLMESQNMRLQLAALALLRAKYYASEMARDCKTLYDTARKTIEDDYDIKLGSEWNEASELNNLMGIREGAPQTKFKGAQFRCPWVFVVLDVCDRVGQSIAQ